MAKYEGINEIVFAAIIESLSEEFVNETFRINFSDKIHYENIKKIITNTLFGNELKSSNASLNSDKSNQKKKILKIIR